MQWAVGPNIVRSIKAKKMMRFQVLTTTSMKMAVF
jgi:hypothetical protein